MTPTKFTWVAPTTNTDGSPIVAGEITGYNLVLRNADASSPGVYTISVPITDPAATEEPLAAIRSLLVVGNYAAAIQTVGPVASGFTGEVTFTVDALQPNAPSSFTVG